MGAGGRCCPNTDEGCLHCANHPARRRRLQASADAGGRRCANFHHLHRLHHLHRSSSSGGSRSGLYDFEFMVHFNQAEMGNRLKLQTGLRRNLEFSARQLLHVGNGGLSQQCRYGGRALRRRGALVPRAWLEPVYPSTPATARVLCPLFKLKERGSSLSTFLMAPCAACLAMEKMTRSSH